MKILITGGLGHIGSYILEKQSFTTDQLTIVDNLSTQRYCSLKHLHGSTFIESCFSTLSTEFIQSFDIIIHLAAITNAAESFTNKQIEEINIEKTKTFLSKCSSSQLIIFPSSTSVYGTAEEIMTEDSITNPQSPYAKSKLVIEEFLEQSNLNYIIFRFGTIFGTSPGMRFHTAINSFCYNIAYDKEVTVWKQNIDMKRPYLGLDDCIQSIKLAIDNSLPKRYIYNVVTQNFTLNEILDLLSNFKPYKIKLVDTPLLNQYSYEVSIDRILKHNFVPINCLKTEILKTFRWLGIYK